MRPAALALTMILAAGSLGGCGFAPLYAAPGAAPSLRSIDVVEPRGRVGFLLREQLDDTLGRDRGAAPRYRLTLTAQETRTPRGLRIDNVATEYELILVVAYTLTDTAGGRVLMQGSTPAFVTFESADAPYAGLAAQSDGQERAAAQAAVDIRLALSRYFAGQAAAS